VARRLAREVRPSAGLRALLPEPDPEHRPFQGVVGQRGFQFQHVHADELREWPALPVVRGRFEPTPSGTRVVVSMSLRAEPLLRLLVFVMAAAMAVVLGAAQAPRRPCT
jgi:hypothetical protein